MENIIRVVECCDHKEIYGYLQVKDISVEEIQQKIYEIKNNPQFLEEYPDWTIEDVFNKFPEEWKWKYIYDNNNVVEI